MRENIFRIFGLFNLAIFVLAMIVWIVPTARSIQAGRESLLLSERSYDVYRRLLRDEMPAPLLQYEQILPELASISEGHAAFGLETREFSAGEISSIASHLYELRASAEYEGNFQDITAFLRDFQNTQGYIRSFTIIKDEASLLRLQFSIFGHAPSAQ